MDEIKKMRHKQFFQNYVCDNLEHAIVAPKLMKENGELKMKEYKILGNSVNYFKG